MRTVKEATDYMRDVAKKRGFPFCEKHGVMHDNEGCIFCADGDPPVGELTQKEGAK